MKLFTTLNEIDRMGGATERPGWGIDFSTLSAHKEHEMLRQINLLDVLDTIGVADAMWCFRAITSVELNNPKNDTHAERSPRIIAVELARMVAPIVSGIDPVETRHLHQIAAALNVANGEKYQMQKMADASVLFRDSDDIRKAANNNDAAYEAIFACKYCCAYDVGFACVTTHNRVRSALRLSGKSEQEIDVMVELVLRKHLEV